MREAFSANTKKSLISLALTALFVCGLVLPVRHVLHTHADGTCTCAGRCAEESSDSHSPESCPICRHVMLAHKIVTALPIAAPIAAPPARTATAITAVAALAPRLLFLSSRPLRAPPAPAL